MTVGSDLWTRPEAEALLAMADGHPEVALERLAPLRAYESGWRFGLEPAYVRGLALLQLNRPKDAILEFERIVDRRGLNVYGITYPLALLHLAKARALVGDTTGSRAAHDQLAACWRHADAPLQALVAARFELANPYAIS